LDIIGIGAVGRTRTIDREAVLDAAERVVARDGATRLTLDAVATEAGISKASVLYDYKSKQALIKAVIERRVATEVARLRSFIDHEGDKPDATIIGRIAAAGNRDSTVNRNVALDLAVALNQHNDLRGAIHETFGSFLDDVERTSAYPRRAKVMYLALEGLTLMECFGFYQWSPTERDELLEEIRSLLQPEPQSHPDRG
jgi:AcrR family transcriptional regulator